MNFSLRKSAEPIIYPPSVVLASQSVGRKMLLEKLGLRFRVVVTHIDEDAIVDKDPIKMIRRRAQVKVDEVVNHPNVYGITPTTKTLVVAADSMAILGSKTYGKARDREDVKSMLNTLMDRTHTFATAVNIVQVELGKEIKRWDKVETTRVTMRKMTQPEIEAYTNRFDFTRFAGGYAINEAPWDVVTKIDGSYTNVIGLPFEILLPILRNLKIII